MIKLTQRHRGRESLTFLTGLTELTRLGNESLLYDKRILTQRGKGAEEDEENSVSLSLCDKINTEAQRQ